MIDRPDRPAQPATPGADRAGTATFGMPWNTVFAVVFSKLQEYTEGMAYEDELRNIAGELNRKGGFWGWSGAGRIEALMGWLHHRGICVYCGAQLVDATYMIGGLATTDHLLPKQKYPELNWGDRNFTIKNYLNAVPSCDGCNGLKRSWDPNTEVEPQLYYSGTDARLTCEMQLMFIFRAKKHIESEREKRKLSNEHDCKNWSEALEKRNGLADPCTDPKIG